MVSTGELAALLGVTPRQARRILVKAGATIQGKLAVISPGDLCLYLEHVGGSEVAAAEKIRRKDFARKLQGMRRDRVECGAPILIEVEERVCRHIRRMGYGGLPEGVEIGSEVLKVQFSSPEDLVQKLGLLALALQSDAGFQQLEGIMQQGRLNLEEPVDRPASAGTRVGPPRQMSDVA